MMVQALEEVGEGLEVPTDTHHTPIVTQPSSSQPQKKQKSRRIQRKETKVPHIEPQTEESVPTPLNDPLLSGKDRMQLSKLMELCTMLSDKVLSLEQIKTIQAAKIEKLKKRVKKLECKKKKRTLGLKRMYKVGLSARIVSSDEEGLSDQDDASKQGRIAEIVADEDLFLINKIGQDQGKLNEKEMFVVDDLDGDEVIMDVTTGENVEQSTKVAEKEVSTADPVTTAGEVVTTTKDTLMEIKAAKPKARGVIVQKPSEFKTTSSSQPSQLPHAKDKGKGIMVKPKKPLKKKDQIAFDEKVARKLKAKMKAEMEEEERIAREKDEANVAIVEEKSNKTQAEVTKGSSKRAGDKLEQESAKRQKLDEQAKAKVDNDQREAEMKMYMKIIPDDEIAIDAIPQATKPTIIMLQHIDREDLETLWKFIKAKYRNTRLEEGYERVLWGDLKVIFEPDIETTKLPKNPGRDPRHTIAARRITKGLQNVKILKEQNKQLLKDLRTSKINVITYKRGLEYVEARLLVYKKNESDYKEDIKLLKREIYIKEVAITELRRKLELAQKQKDEIQLTVEIFENSSKSLNKLIDCQIVDKCKTGNVLPPKLDLSCLEEFVNESIVSEATVKKPIIETSEAKASEDKSKVVRKNFGPLLIEDLISDSEDEADSKSKIKKEAVKPSFAKIKFVKSKGKVKSPRKTIGNPQQDLQDKGVINNGCSRYMIGNMSYLTDYKEIDRGYVAFGGNLKGGKITGGVPRKNNMYSVDLKNIVPKRDLTCLFSKATSAESKLQYRRLGDLNFKTMNKLVKGNLARGLPSKLFEHNQDCVACQKGKQHRASCTKACDDAGKARMETIPRKDYILLPLWTVDPLISQESKSSQDDRFQPSSDDGKKVDDPRQESKCKDQEKEDNVNNTNNVNAASTNEVNVVSANTNNELPFDPEMPALEDISTINFSSNHEDDDEEADMNNLDTSI
nr:ribonuclease H-like domain-containing protein [Tanacetum cinerariifolium]